MITIRTASVEDIPAIRAIVDEVWPLTYAGIISGAQIDYMLHMMYSESSLYKQFAEGCEFILAEDNGGPVGFASYQSLNGKTYKLHKLYLLSALHGNGIGKKLLDEVCDRVKKNGADELELQVNKSNGNAKDFYTRNNFRVKRELILEIGNGFVMDDYVMSRDL